MRASINIWLLVVFIVTTTYKATFSSYNTATRAIPSTLPFLSLEQDRCNSHFNLCLSTLPFLTTEQDRLTHTHFPVTPKQANSESLSHTLPNTMSSSTSHTLSVTLITEPRIHLRAWLKAVHKFARPLGPTLDQYGALYLVCSDTAWQQLKRNRVPDLKGGPITIRPRPIFPAPV